MKESIRVNNKSIQIVNNRIYIDGEEYIPKGQNVSEVEFVGTITKLTADCSFSIKGDVKGDIDLGGSLSIIGNIEGNIDTGGSVNITGNHNGGIDAGGSVNINNGGKQ